MQVFGPSIIQRPSRQTKLFLQQQRLVYNVRIGLALGTRQTSLWCTAVLETTGTKNVKDTWVGPHY